ncbi:MAG: AI-2E family transporter [Flavisolibacter sp.]|jgi:predicted PurR-regulated permease PerM
MQSNSKQKEYSFPQKVWIAGGIVALMVVLLLLLKATFSVFMLILAGVLIAIFFHGLSGWMENKTKWKASVCLVISVIGTCILIVLLFWLLGAKIQAQIAELSDTLPTTIENAKAQLDKSALGQKVVEKISSPKTQKKAEAVVQTFFKSTFGILGDLYVVLFLGIFFTVSPKQYKKGIVALVPQKAQSKADEVLTKIAVNLKKWLKGKIFAMFVVFILTAIGLIIIGLPMWLTLALIAGILNFIPNFGPLIAMIPAVLIGLMQSPSTAAVVAGLYILVQVTESNFITPKVQQRLINIPPALIIIAQLLISPLTGGWGLVLATPLMVIIIVLVQQLYIKKEG